MQKKAQEMNAATGIDQDYRSIRSILNLTP